MNNSDLVGRRQRTCDLHTNAYDFQLRKRTLALSKSLVKRVSVQELHHVIERAIWKLAKVEYLDEATVANDIDGTRFVEKPLCKFLILCQVRMQNLYCGSALDLGILCFVDNAHPALTELAHDAEVPEQSSYSGIA